MQPLDAVLAALTARDRKPKRSGAGYVALCPAHDDGRNPSLSIREGDDGRVLLKCHGADCDAESITHALGLEPSDLFADRPLSDNIAATYDYTDEGGALLYQNVRLVPKDFRWRRPVSDSKGTVSDWIWTLDDVRRVPYRLPSVLIAAGNGRAVWLVEGEKDADALEALGFAATSSKHWHDEFCEFVDGAAFALVVADCDQARPDKPNEKRGRETAQAVAATLRNAGIRVKVIDLDPTREDGYDVADFIVQHGDDARARLETLARTTPEWIGQQAPSPKLPIVSFREFAGNVERYDESLDYLGALVRGGKRLHVIGPIGHGKTTFVAEMLAAAVNGRDFLGLPGRGNLRALYVELGDMSPEEIRETLIAARFNPDADGFDLAVLADGLQIDRNEQDRRMLESAYASYDIIAIDPWYKLIGEEQADGMKNVRLVTSFLDGLRDRYPRTAAVIGFHAREMQRGQRLHGLGDASGYKAFQRGANTAVGFDRVAGDRSRLNWLKTRSQHLPKMGEYWLIEWTRGQGFVRVERRAARYELLDLLGDEWRDVYDIAEEFGRARNRVSSYLTELALEGAVESRVIVGRKEWRKRPENQEALAV